MKLGQSLDNHSCITTSGLRAMLMRLFYPKWRPQVATMSIILAKYSFLKGVKPHCSTKSALFLTKLGHPTENHPWFTSSAWNAVQRGLRYPTMGIILVKYWFIKGVKPHCYAKYALFLTKLGRPTEIPLVYFECITCYGRGGALYPKWNPQVPTIGIMLTTLLLSQMGNLTVPRELCLVHDETVSTYRNSKSVKRCMLSSTLNHVNGAPSAYQGIILRNCPFEKE